MGAAHSASGPRRGGHRTGVASASSESRERQQRRSAAQQAADDVSLRGPIAVEWPHERGRKPFEAHPKVRMRSRTKAAEARMARDNQAFDAANPRVEWNESMTAAAEARKLEAAREAYRRKTEAKSRRQQALAKPPRFRKKDAIVAAERLVEAGRWMSRKRAALVEVLSPVDAIKTGRAHGAFAGGVAVRGEIEILQLDDQYKMVFHDFSVSQAVEEGGAPGPLFVYLSGAEAVKVKGNVETACTIVRLGGDEGTINGMPAHFEHLLDSALVDKLHPLDVHGVYLAKPALREPLTEETTVVAIANFSEFDVVVPPTSIAMGMAVARDAMDRLMARHRAQSTFNVARRRSSVALYKKHAGELAQVAPHLSQVRRQALLGYRLLKKEPLRDTINVVEFQKLLDTIDVVMLHPRSTQLFNLVDLDRTGQLDLAETELAVDVANQVPPETRLGPLDAFNTFEVSSSVASRVAIVAAQAKAEADAKAAREGAGAGEGAAEAEAEGKGSEGKDAGNDATNAAGDDEANHANVDEQPKKTKKVIIQSTTEADGTADVGNEGDESAGEGEERGESDVEIDDSGDSSSDGQESEEEQLDADADAEELEAAAAKREARRKLKAAKKKRQAPPRSINFLQVQECLKVLGLEDFLYPPEPKQQVKNMAKLVDLYRQHKRGSLKRGTDGVVIDDFVKLWSEVVDPVVELAARGAPPVTFAAEPRKKRRLRKNRERLLELVYFEAEQKREMLTAVRDRCLERRKQDRLRRMAKSKAERKVREVEQRDEAQAQAVRNKKERQRRRKEKEEEDKKAEQYKRLVAKQAQARTKQQEKQKENFHAAMEERKAAELALRRKRGEEKVHMRSQKLVSVPEDVYVGKAAQSRLIHVLSMDFERNKLEKLPDKDFFYWLGELRRLVLSRNALRQLPTTELPALQHLQILDVSNNNLAALPDEVGELHELCKLCAAHNQLKFLPRTIGRLERLKLLDVNNNVLERLPVTIGDMRALETLDAGCNRLWELPDEVTLLSELRRMCLSWNRISELPEDIGALRSLEYLEMAANGVKMIPPSFGQLRQLDMLLLRENEIFELGHQQMAELHSLRYLDVSRNVLYSVDRNIGKCTSLQMLYLDHNNLKTIPDELGRCTQMEKLYIHHNEITDFKDNFAAMGKMKHLDAAFNEIGPDLPEEFGLMSQMITLDLSHNRLEDLPRTIGQLTQLEQLYLRKNELQCLPETLVGITSLATLDVSANALRSLRDLPFDSMDSLRRLDLSGNRLRALPTEFCVGAFVSLTELNLRSNNLRAVPPEFAELQARLVKLDIEHNPFDKHTTERKWCSDWGPKQQAFAQSHVHSAALQVPEVVELAAEREEWYKHAVEEWALTGEAHYENRSSLHNFLEAVEERMTSSVDGRTMWSLHHVDQVQRFYFECKEHNVVPKYHALADDEIAHDAEQRERGRARRQLAVERVRNEHEREMENQDDVYFAELPSKVLRSKTAHERHLNTGDILWEAELEDLQEECAKRKDRQERAAQHIAAKSQRAEAEAILELRLQVNEANCDLIQKRKEKRMREKKTVLALVGGSKYNGQDTNNGVYKSDAKEWLSWHQQQQAPGGEAASPLPLTQRAQASNQSPNQTPDQVGGAGLAHSSIYNDHDMLLEELEFDE